MTALAIATCCAVAIAEPVPGRSFQVSGAADSAGGVTSEASRKIVSRLRALASDAAAMGTRRDPAVLSVSAGERGRRVASDYSWSRLNVLTPVYSSQVEMGSVCPTLFFDQSHTPCGKIEHSRATSAGVNVTV